MGARNLQDESKRILKVCQEFGLSFAASIDILECVKAYEKYEELPQATKESLQVICDMFNVSLCFSPLKRGKIALTGIYNDIRSTYLYTKKSLADRSEKKHWLKNNSAQYHLKPNANHILKKYCMETHEFIL